MNWGRAAAAAVLGIVGGVLLGLLAAMLVVWVWFDVLHLPPPNDEPKPGLEVLGLTAPVLMGLGGIGGAWVMVRRVRAGRRLGAWGWVFGLTIVLVAAWLGVIVS